MIDNKKKKTDRNYLPLCGTMNKRVLWWGSAGIFFLAWKQQDKELAMEMGMQGYATGKEKRGFPEQYLRQNTKQSLSPQGEKN